MRDSWEASRATLSVHTLMTRSEQLQAQRDRPMAFPAAAHRAGQQQPQAAPKHVQLT